jgi:WD40 repeat protein
VPETAPFIFLSHSGADSDAARDLKRRLLESPDAREASLKVWFDKDDLRPGGQWQPQIEQAIANASAFVVFVGSKGVMNWVEAEVRVALSRANADAGFLFIPALAADSAGSSALPPFAKLYQGVRDPLSDSGELAKLLKAVLQSDWDKAPKIIDEPFVGLRSMREEEADRFFGRDAEVRDLAEKFRRHRIVAIVADSGTGKSSLAQAGFIPAFRGGALADLSRENPEDHIWNVVTMRPGANPEEGLRSGVIDAAERLGRSAAECEGLRERVVLADPSKTAYALKCNVHPAQKTTTLLIVDQFEEVFTETPDALCAPLIRILLSLADGASDVRILLTVRADYFNLLSAIKDAEGHEIKGADGRSLFDRLTANGGDAILRLKRISEAALRDAVCKPLTLAGDKDVGAQEALLKAVRREISDQPSDLPLLQVALRATWREHNRPGGLGLLEAYQSVGGVLGALAREAEAVRTRLSSEDQARLESVFVRLVRLGDTGGATRRTAGLNEFDEARQNLLRRLGDDEHGRLVVVSEFSAEIAHEALITQWPWLQRTLKEDARDVRRLDRLMGKTREWREAPPENRREGYLAFGIDRELFGELANQRRNWLSPDDKEFLTKSEEWKASEQKREWWRTWLLRAAVAAITCALVGVGVLYFMERQARREGDNALVAADAATKEAVTQKALADQKAEEAIEETQIADAATKDALAQKALADSAAKKAVRNESVALTVLANIEAANHPINAAKLALAAWPRDKDDATTPKLSATLDVLGRIVPNLREQRLIGGHGDLVLSAALSPDGTRIVARSLDKTARVWDAATGKAIVVLRGHEDQVNSAAFSPDGSSIVTASSDNTARVWDAATGKAIAVLSGHENSVSSAVFSPDGSRIVTASDDKTARLWDAATGKVIAVLSGHNGEVNSAAFSPDGSRIVTASWDKTARVWDAATGKAIAVLSGHENSVSSAVFSPDGSRIVTASDDKTARLWDAATGKAIAVLSGHANRVNSAVFSPDGSRIVTASWDKTARVWDAATGKAIAVLNGHEGPVSSAAFNPDGSRIVTASDDKTARLWDAAAGKAIAVLSGHEGPVWSAAFSSDGSRIVTASGDKTARLWDAATGKAIAVLNGHEGPVSSAVFSSDGSRIVTASDDKTARLWDAATGKTIAALSGHEREVRSAAFSLDGSRIVTASSDNTARVWDAATGKAIAVLIGHGNRVNSAVFSPDGSRIVTASDDKTARLWDAATGKAIAVLSGHEEKVRSAAFSPDGLRIVTASLDGTARVWDAATGEAIAVLSGHEGPVYSATFSPDGSRIVTASSDDTARAWDAATGKAIATLSGHRSAVWSAAFSPDGSRIVTASEDGTARVGDAVTGNAIAVLSGHEASVTSAAFSPDGSRIVTASFDGTARLWDAATGEAIAVFNGHEGQVLSAAFSPDGSRIVTASGDNTARVWDVSAIPKGNFLQVACALLNGNFSLEGVTEYPLALDRPICATDPPPDLTAESAAKASAAK